MMMTGTTMTARTMTTGMTEPLHLRHEIKHQISPQEDLVLTHRLRKLFSQDGHAGPDGSYQVTSLYFDTPYDTALREKLDGVDRREKFRLRYYGAHPTFFKLEKKYKVNGLCGKRSARLTLHEAEQLLAGEDAFLLERGEPLLAELYHKMRGTLLRPRTVVCYDREAFLYAPGNVRVTLDRNLRTCGDSAGFLSPAPFPLKPLDGVTVLEVKYDAFLPDLVRLVVQTPDRRAGACSKYALCRRFD